MSYTASVTATTGIDHAYQVASNQGFNDLCDWFDGLNWEEFKALAVLRNYGWHEPSSTVRDELVKAVKINPPKPSVLKTIRSLVSFIKKNDPDGVLIFSQ